VLVVESDPELQEQMARTLRRQGHRVVGTASGGGALALLSEWAVDLVLVSADLPGRSGLDVARQIQRARPHTCVVMVANHVEPSISAAAHAAGAVACVPKPLELESLAPWLPSANNALPEHEAVAE
jgi:CheY-like chemotaxis protein